MKKLIYLFLALGLFACDSSSKLDPNAMISIRPAIGAWNASVQKVKGEYVHLSALEIVKQATNINFHNDSIYSGAMNRGFADSQKDTVNVLLKMWGTDIISQDGKYQPVFINSHDMVLRKVTFISSGVESVDTLGYIPNAVMAEARTKIKAAYDTGDYETVYSLFNTAFTFLPVTGEEFKQLQIAKLN